MAAITATTYLIYAAYAAATVAGVVQQKKSSKFQQETFNQQAKDEETQARERELERKKKINKVLAAQIAGLGASGIAAEGSPQLIATESLRDESLGGLADVATRAGRTRNLLASGNAARKLGNIQATSTILSSIGNIGIGLSGT